MKFAPNINILMTIRLMTINDKRLLCLSAIGKIVIGSI